MKHEMQILKALSDPGRVRIVKMLEQREMCVCEIVAALDLAQPTISKHLKLLNDAGVIESRRNGSWIYYSLANAAPDSFTGEMLSVLSRHMNTDATVTRLISILPKLSPQNLKCQK